MRFILAVLFLPSLLFTVAAGCTSESSSTAPTGQGTSVKSLDEVKKEAPTLDKPALQKMVDDTKALMAAKEKEVQALLAKLQETSPADLIADAGKKLNADKDRLVQEIERIKANLEVYMQELTKRS